MDTISYCVKTRWAFHYLLKNPFLYHLKALTRNTFHARCGPSSRWHQRRMILMVSQDATFSKDFLFSQENQSTYKLKLYFTWMLWKERKCQKMHWSLQKNKLLGGKEKEESTSQVEIGGGTQTPTRKILATDIERSRTSTACWQEPEKRLLFFGKSLEVVDWQQEGGKEDWFWSNTCWGTKGDKEKDGLD